MTDIFLWPWALAVLALVPLLVWLYRRNMRPPAKTAALHPDLVLLSSAAKRGSRAARHWPALFYLVACMFAFVALARPTFAVPEANPQAGIMLALDVSRSMQGMDVEPSRFEAARAAVKTFVQGLPNGTQVGLVTFAGYATQVVPPTDDHERLLEAVDLLRMDFGTVIGDAMIASMRALPDLETRQGMSDDPSSLATIILLTDGRNFGGVEPLVALNRVKEQQITVHTIGVGSATEGDIPGIPPQYQFAARFDESILRTIAEETNGEYVFVDSAGELKSVYRALSRSLVWRFQREEATAVGALAAALLLCLSVTLGELRRRVL